ncbi:MAG TPA: hypothetical protein VFQ49_16305 [Actinomycetes bacterium]|nr:hypothetical protein [Actinomycetes bacterium]
MEPEAPEGSGEPRRGAPVDQAPWGGASRSIGGLYRSVPTAGVHEVVIHNPDHEATLADLPPVAVARTMAAWRRRLAVRRDQAFGAVLVIVNQGRTAGASLEHPHSQVFATAAAGRSARVASWSGLWMTTSWTPAVGADL